MIQVITSVELLPAIILPTVPHTHTHTPSGDIQAIFKEKGTGESRRCRVIYYKVAAPESSG